MTPLLPILLATFLISLGALAGMVTFFIKEAKLQRILLFFVSLSAGALMGGAFLHLMPEAVEALDPNQAFTIILVSFIAFFLIEKTLHWRHCHKGHCDVHSFGYMNLIGDSFHNFLDGLLLSAAFITDVKLGIISTLAVALHEIPQEIGDYGVLLYAGFHKKKALLLNFAVALMVVLGGLVGYLLSTQNEAIIPFLIPVAAGGFLYISASDLMPEIRKETSLKKSLVSFGVFLSGIALMYAVKLLGVE